MSLFSWTAPQIPQKRDPGPCQLDLMPIIVGAPRSGTTLLRLMLDSHPALAIPPETGFLKLATELKGRNHKLRERFVRALMTYPAEAPCWADFEISEEALRTAVAAVSPFSVAEGYRAFYRLYAGRFGKSRWGDKTPLYCLSLPTIRKVLPEARFVHIIRDGRAAALSLKRMWFSPSDKIGDLASYWRNCVLEARRAGLGRPDYVEVRYEDLILNADATLNAICNFIDMEYDEAMLKYYIRAPMRLKEHKGRTLSDGTSLVNQEERIRQQQRTTEPPDPAQILGWKTAISAKERKEFEDVAGDLLTDLGYETEGNHVASRQGKSVQTMRVDRRDRKMRERLNSISRHGARLRSAFRLLVGNQSPRSAEPTSPALVSPTLPDVFPFAVEMGQRFECAHLIALGESTAVNLLRLNPSLEIIGVVPGKDLAMCSQRNRRANWVEGAFDGAGGVSLAPKTLQQSIIVCTDVVERLASPEPLFEHLRKWLDHAPLCILTSGASESAESDVSPAEKRFGRWSLKEFERLLSAAGFKLQFIGLTASDARSFEKGTILAVITNNASISPYKVKAPADFRVVAFMAAYNEEDIIVESIKKWTDQGIEVHILENWSTDKTFDLAKQLETNLPVTVERFPSTGPSRHFNWGAMLERIETLSKTIDADWFIRRGADEILTSPWSGGSYRDSLYVVDQTGFNCVDHTVIDFHPVDDGFQSGTDHERHFTYFEFGKDPCNFLQRKTWKNCGRRISMVPTGGHDLPFRGRRVYPFKFLLKHYPVRSQSHGEQKIFRERKARWNPEERAKGWHIQYDAIEEGHVFLRPACEQEYFSEEDFNRTYLVERLSGIGILR